MATVYAAALAAVVVATRVSAQAALHPIAVTRLDAAPRSASLAPPPPYGDLRAASTYMGWGGAIGASGGLVWALSTDHHSLNALKVVAYPVAGFAIGLVGGAVTYVVHEALNR